MLGFGVGLGIAHMHQSGGASVPPDNIIDGGLPDAATTRIYDGGLPDSATTATYEGGLP